MKMHPAPTKKPTKPIVHADHVSKPQTHRGDADKASPTNYVAVPHPDPTSGYMGKLVADTPAARAAQAKFEKTLHKLSPAAKSV
jgi:hypothetical protein